MGEVETIKKKNYSCTYIAPLIDNFVTLNKNVVVNTFLFDINYPEYNSDMVRGLFVLLKYEKDKTINKEIISSKYHVMHYPVDNNYYMVYIKFPLDIIQDTIYVIQGKYSKLSDKSKGLILKYHNQTRMDKLYKILHKSPEYRKELENSLNVILGDEVELGNIIDQSKEVFTTKVDTILLEN